MVARDDRRDRRAAIREHGPTHVHTVRLHHLLGSGRGDCSQREPN
jgi:hypothetical protein